jgi:predicted Fe-Mo cluster-binding NifX family protein
MGEHFGRCHHYTLADIEDGKVKEVSVVDNPFYDSHDEPGEVPNFIQGQGADVMITGGIGPKAIGFFNQFGIEVVTGASGRVGDAVNSYLKGILSGSAPCQEEERRPEETERGAEKALRLREEVAFLEKQLVEMERKIAELEKE